MHFVINWLSKTNFTVSSAMHMLCPMFLSPSYLEGGFISGPIYECNSKNGFEVLLEIWALSSKLLYNFFDTFKFKIWIVCDLAISQFLWGALWQPMSANQLLFTFCFYSFIYLIFVRFYILFLFFLFYFYFCIPSFLFLLREKSN